MQPVDPGRTPHTGRRASRQIHLTAWLFRSRPLLLPAHRLSASSYFQRNLCGRWPMDEQPFSKSLFKICQNAIPAHLFPLGRVDLTGNTQSIPASNRLAQQKNLCPSGIPPDFRTCIHSRRCRRGEGFFRQTRRVFAGMLGAFQENATRYGGKRPAQTAFEVVNTGS